MLSLYWEEKGQSLEKNKIKGEKGQSLTVQKIIKEKIKLGKKRDCPPIKLKKQIIKLTKVLLCYNLKEVM